MILRKIILFPNGAVAQSEHAGRVTVKAVVAWLKITSSVVAAILAVVVTVQFSSVQFSCPFNAKHPSKHRGSF